MWISKRHHGTRGFVSSSGRVGGSVGLGHGVRVGGSTRPGRGRPQTPARRAATVTAGIVGFLVLLFAGPGAFFWALGIGAVAAVVAAVVVKVAEGRRIVKAREVEDSVR
jgi:hypothetical protein